MKVCFGNQITLGALIALLEERDPEETVVFDFGGLVPTHVSSYRGFFDHLALAYEERSKDMLVAELLTELKGAIGHVFGGWKGGEFEMTEDTPIWAANRGEAHYCAIVGLADCQWQTVIKTEYTEP